MPPPGRDEPGHTPIVPQPKTRAQAVAESLKTLLCCRSDAITTSMLETSPQAERPGVSGGHVGFSGKIIGPFRPLIDLMMTVLKGLRLPDKNQREILIPLQITQGPFTIRTFRTSIKATMATSPRGTVLVRTVTSSTLAWCKM
jgi:hypothetical protein